jgi:ABC-2 type transport system ATP-binding protein
VENMNVIECNGLTKTYGKHTALNHLSFAIQENKITGLIGRNGAGKTTLLKLIAGFLNKTSGEIKVLSEDPFNSLKVSANMIFIDDKLNFPPSMTLHEIMTWTETFYKNWDKDLANRLFTYFSFQPKQRHHQLSKGMKSTFHMILGLAAKCPLTIFDEPTSGMDTATRKDFYRALLKDYIDHPRTIILSSHLLNEVEHILEDVLLIHEGQKILHLSIDDLHDYAVGIEGDLLAVQHFTNDKEILFQKRIGENHMYAVVKNNLLDIKRVSDLQVKPVSADDICVYLTNKSIGGIDDAFNRS